MKRVLFLCTGNYYRSRFAEEYFNHVAREKGLGWEANSRGLSLTMPNPENPGPISVHTISALTDRGIEGTNLSRFPIPVVDDDFETHDKIIALSEEEHRPMIASRFRSRVDDIIFFEVGDLPIEEPVTAINKIAALIDTLVVRL